MPVTVTLELPADVEQELRRETADLDADVKESYAVELFRRGKLTHFELSKVLGLDRFQTDAVLKRHNVTEDLPTPEETKADLETLNRVLAGKGR